jgi:phage portal protein BeeE
MTTFLDDFRPVRQSTAADSASFRTLTGPGDTSRTNNLVSTRQQLKSYRFWNYIAINRICTKLAQMMPMVSLPTRGMRVSQRHLSFKQREHLETNYSGTLQSVADDLTPLPDTHPLVKLLAKPNGRDWWGVLVWETHLYWQLTGRFYWWLVPNGLGLPVEIHCVPTDMVLPQFDNQGTQTGWKLQRPGTVAPLNVPLNEIVEGKFPSPLGKLEAQSPSQAGDLWIDNSEALEESRGFSMRNSVRPSVLLSFDEKHEKVSEDVLDRLKEKFSRKILGISRSGEPLIAPPGIKVTPWGTTPKEMDFPESSDQLRDGILSLRGVPKALAGMNGDLNKASIEGAEVVFCDYTVNPLAALFAGFITSNVAGRFDPRIIVWFDDVKPRDASQEREEWKLDFGMGAASPDERRSYRGQKPWGVKGVSDVGYLPSSIVPVDDIEDDPIPAPGRGGRQPADKGDDSEDMPSSDDEDAPAAAQQSFSFFIRQSGRSARRDARIVAGWSRLHESQEKAGALLVKRFWSQMTPKIVKRLKDATSGRMFPTAEELIEPSVFRDDFNRLWIPRWNELAWRGVELEQAWIGRKLDNAQSFHGLMNAWGVTQAAPVPSTRDPRPPSDINVDVNDDTRRALESWLNERSVGVWGQVSKTTKKKLEAALRDGIVAGDDLDDMVQRVQGELAEYSSRQARVLARTETTGGMNRGQQLARVDAEIVKKRWVATMDARTRTVESSGRFDHLDANRQVVTNEGVFVVSGEKLLHPGDTSNGASSGNVVQCRCVAVAHFDDDDDDTPAAPAPVRTVTTADPMPKPRRSKAKVIRAGDPNKPAIADVEKELFDRAVDNDELAAIVAAPDDARVEVMTTKDRHLVIITDHRDYSSVRTVKRVNGKLVMRNESISLNDKKRGAGLGTDLFAQQVANLRESGFDRIEALALRTGGRKGANGYYTWPRLGYNAPLPQAVKDRLSTFTTVPNLLADIAASKSYLDLFLTKAGRELWRKHGESIDNMVFDLKPSSRNSETLRTYLAKRMSNEPKQHWSVITQDGDREPIAEEIDLSPEEIEASDRAFDELAEKYKTNPPPADEFP